MENKCRYCRYVHEEPVLYCLECGRRIMAPCRHNDAADLFRLKMYLDEIRAPDWKRKRLENYVSMDTYQALDPEIVELTRKEQL